MGIARVAVALLLIAAPAVGAPLRVVVRRTGAGDEVALGRLAGQIVDLDVDPLDAPGPLEPTLDLQLLRAARLAAERAAAAVVWFRAAGDALVVAVATPGDRRLLVRTLEAGDPSATAEAAAQAARTALRALTLGGSIGVALPALRRPPAAAAIVAAPDGLRGQAAVGWQLCLDRGAEVGAHALWQRVAIGRGRWAGALEVTLGPPLRKDGAVALELARSSAVAAIDHRRGAFRFTLGGGLALYQRATVAVPDGLMATDTRAALAGVLAPAVGWRAGRAGFSLEVAVGLDVVLGAPALTVERAGRAEVLSEIAVLQPRLTVGVVTSP